MLTQRSHAQCDSIHLYFERLTMEPIRTLIIDNHPGVRRALSERLSNSDSIFVTAATGDMVDGRQRIDLEKPDAVLIGLRAQEDPRDITSIAEIATQLATWKAALLVLTSYSFEDERRDILLAGARRYLLKDIDTDHLIDEIQQSVLESRSVSQPTYNGDALIGAPTPKVE